MPVTNTAVRPIIRTTAFFNAVMRGKIIVPGDLAIGSGADDLERIEVLPEGLHVTGDLFADRTALTKVRGLRVDGIAYISAVPETILALTIEGLTVGKDALLGKRPTVLRGCVRVDGNIYSENLVVETNDFEVGGHLSLAAAFNLRTNNEALRQQLFANGKVHVNGKVVTQAPALNFDD